MDIEIVGEIVLYQNSNYKRVRRYLKGIHPTRGKITKGYTGWETVEELDLVFLRRFDVIDLTPSIVTFIELEAKLI